MPFEVHTKIINLGNHSKKLGKEIGQIHVGILSHYIQIAGVISLHVCCVKQTYANIQVILQRIEMKSVKVKLKGVFSSCARCVAHILRKINTKPVSITE
jgi:hypothetical protein